MTTSTSIGTRALGRRPLARAARVGVALAVVAGGLVICAPPAVADTTFATPVATGPRPTAVLAASGPVIVTRTQETASSGFVRWSKDGGASWHDWGESFVPRGAASYVAKGTAVWGERNGAGKYNVNVVDLSLLGGAGALEKYELPEDAAAVTDTHAILGAGRQYRIVELSNPADPTRLQLDGQLKAPGKSTYALSTWVFSTAGKVYRTAWSKSLSARSTHTDLDPLAPSGGFGPKPFRVKGHVPYVGVVWKTNGADGLALIEFVQQTGKKINWCTREWNTAVGTMKAISCRRITTAKASASLAAARYGSVAGATANSPVIGLTIAGAQKLWRSNKLVSVKTVKGAKIAFTGVGDPIQPFVRAQAALSGALYRVAVTNGAVTKLAGDFVGSVPPSALDLSLTRITGLDGRDRSKAWERPVNDTEIGAESVVAGATLGYQTSGGRVVKRTSSRLEFFDKGSRKAGVSAVSALRDTSGPYTMVTRSGKNLVLGPTGAVVAQPTKGYQIAAIFGSVVVEQNTAKTAIRVRELTGKRGFPVTGTIPGASGGWRISSVLVWGDQVVVGTARNHFRYAYVFSLLTRRWGAEAKNAAPVAIGDGVVAIQNVTSLPASLALWDTANDFEPARAGAKVIADADPAVVPALDGMNRLVYSTGKSLKVIDLKDWDGADLSGRTGPRVLGAIAPTSYEINAPGGWNLALDVTRPVDAGVVEVVRGTGPAAEVVARLAADDDGDGSVRVNWNGAKLVDPDGEGPEPPAMTDGLTPASLVANGDYTWRYLAKSGSAGVVNINGSDVPSGKIRVSTAPIKSAKPKISGKLAVGSKLTATHSWSPAGLTYAYQWFANKVPIATDGTAKTYTLTPAERGKTITVRVTATNRRFDPATPRLNTATQTSKATKKTGYGTLGRKKPTIAGTVKAGVELTANTGAWTPSTTSFTYQWYRVNKKNKAKAIAKATAATYTPVAADVGQRLRVRVTGKAPGYRTASADSAITRKVAAG